VRSLVAVDQLEVPLEEGMLGNLFSKTEDYGPEDDTDYGSFSLERGPSLQSVNGGRDTRKSGDKPLKDPPAERVEIVLTPERG
jgi:hypothetical protein